MSVLKSMGYNLRALSGFLICLFVLQLNCSQSNHIEKYIVEHSDLSPEIILALRSGKIIIGMTTAQVKLLLGEPKVIEPLPNTSSPTLPPQGERERWIYQWKEAKIEQPQTYNPDSAFPQGIGFVIPFHYHAKEIVIIFAAGKVCRIEHVIASGRLPDGQSPYADVREKECPT